MPIYERSLPLPLSSEAAFALHEDPKILEALLSENPVVKFHNQERGYVRCVVTPKDWTSDYVVVEDVEKPGAPAIKRASFVVESGKAGAETA